MGKKWQVFFGKNIVKTYFFIYKSRLDKEEVEDKKDTGPKTIDVGKEAAIEAEVQAARQRAVVPLEIRMKQFRDMLSEKDVCIICQNRSNLICQELKENVFSGYSNFLNQ